MPTSTNEKTAELTDFSGGVQRNTSEYLRLPNELTNAINASYKRIGTVEKSGGYTQLGSQISTTSSSSTSTTTTSTSSSSSSSSSTSTSSTTTMA